MDDLIFTPIEQQVATLLRAGRTNREIGATLHRSEGNIKNHVAIMLQKTGLRNRVELALFLERTACTCRYVVPRRVKY